MKIALFTILLFVWNVTFADDQKYLPPYEVDIEKFDSTLTGNESNYQFNFICEGENIAFKGHEIYFELDGDGENKRIKLNENGEFVIKTSAGQHSFVIYFSNQFEEIYTTKIEVSPKHKRYIKLFLRRPEFEIIQDKPVIYLYPEVEKSVSVKVDNGGELTFTYPKYENGWNVVAQPSGKISHNGTTFNYLFWEGKKEYTADESVLSEGFIVEGKNSLEFLEKHLTAFGFTNEEKADFITFWGPRMTADKEWFVHFVVNEDCLQFADVQFEPKPDHFYRFYILLAPFDEVKNELKSEPKAQVLTPMKREGFVAFEWGGSYIHSTNL